MINGETIIQTFFTDKSPDTEEVVTTDKHLIDQCDIFVAYINKITFGTVMEIMYAYQQRKPIFIIIPPGKGWENDIWLSYHTSKFFFATEPCFDYIVQLTKECNAKQKAR